MEKEKLSWVPVAHACNHSYAGGRDQEYPGLKPAWANSLPVWKKLIKGLIECLKV
jgi:hypothetical protein